MWTETARNDYDRRSHRYATDLTDEGGRSVGWEPFVPTEIAATVHDRFCGQLWDRDRRPVRRGQTVTLAATRPASRFRQFGRIGISIYKSNAEPVF